MENRIRILATSDVHGYIYPYLYSSQQEEDMGLAKCKALIDSLKDSNTLLIDNGDNLEGSPLVFWHYKKEGEEKNPVTIAMNAMGYDYINLGNHDFDYGEDALFEHVSGIEAPVITSNILYKGKPLGPTYVIRTIAGKKIALIAVTSQYIPHWEPKAYVRHFKFPDAFETLQNTVELVKRSEHPDYIIGIYHGGFEKDPETGKLLGSQTGENEGYRMMQDIKGLDVLIAGHQHNDACGKCFDTYYTETRANGQSIACIDIYTDTNTIEPRLFNCDGEADQAMEALVQPYEDRCQQWLDTELGTSKVDLKVSDPLKARLSKSQFVTLMNQAAMEYTGAQLASSSIYMHAPGLGSIITIRDLISSYPFPNTLVVKEINGKTLREYLEKAAEFWGRDNSRIIIDPQYDYPHPKYYDYDMVDGIDYTIDVSRDPGSRITSLRYNGEDATDDMLFSIAVTSYRASGGGGYGMLAEARTVKSTSKLMIDILADYIREHKMIDFEPVDNIHIVY